jgi:hypothetical protein
LARRARKRRPGAAPSAPPRPAAPPPARGNDLATSPRADRVATSPRGDTPAASPPANPREAMSRGYARAREKDEAARAALKPLAPGERPWPIALSAILAAAFAIANVVLVIAGWEGESSVAAPLIFAAVMLVAAVGMWQLKYWAVLGWEVLLGVTFVGALLSLLRASNAWGAVLAVIVMALTGPLFYLLIRQMARIQMPTRK